MQKSLTNEIVNCSSLLKKHKWSLIDSTQYTYTFKCLNCPVNKVENIFEYHRVRKYKY